ncbi:MAG: endopeptidase La [bacterium]|nr:endopeptidase La [bacterium]
MKKKKQFNIEDITKLPLLPARDIVFFPAMVMPLAVGRERSMLAVENTMIKDRLIFIVTQKDFKVEDPQKKDLYNIGVIAEVLQLLKMPDGTLKILVEGVARAKLGSFDMKSLEYIEVGVEPILEKKDASLDVKAKMRNAVDLFNSYFQLNKCIPADINQTIINIEDPNQLVDTVAIYLNVKIKEKQKLLALLDINKRLDYLTKLLVSENKILKLEKKIQGRVKTQIEKSQKEYYLNEQIKAIQKELHKQDDQARDMDELKSKIEKTKMPQDAKEKAEKEWRRLSKMSSYSPEATVSRTYIEWLIEMPWDVRTEDNLDLKHAKIVLDNDHYGLDKAKERVLEYLAVCKLTKKLKGPILCFIGPPGVGKTSIAKSIAGSMGRKFVRISLGGVHDEAEIRGHRRTYIGALPGRIIQSIKKSGSKNPVFCLDEIDKLGSDFRGDPSSALLEVLDGEQNSTFADHYLEVDFDLSDIMFITTANDLYSIPPALLDRMEIVEFSGYTTLEKKAIAKKYLIPKKMDQVGLKKKDLVIDDSAMNETILKYTAESGVRNLEREIARICRKIARKKVEEETVGKIKVNKDTVGEYLGIPKYNEDIFAQNEIGIATGLAWTEFGGDVLNIEVTRMQNKGGLDLTLTGKLGDVMKESAQTALSYLRANSRSLGIPQKAFEDTEIHIHVPEGAIPKDGPSAGITMTTAMLSSLTKRKIKKKVAMTGEITLTGRVLPIGGLKEKMLAAYRTGVKQIIIPAFNNKDLEDIPKEVLSKIEVIQVKDFKEVAAKALM